MRRIVAVAMGCAMLVCAVVAGGHDRDSGSRCQLARLHERIECALCWRRLQFRQRLGHGRFDGGLFRSCADARPKFGQRSEPVLVHAGRWPGFSGQQDHGREYVRRTGRRHICRPDADLQRKRADQHVGWSVNQLWRWLDECGIHQGLRTRLFVQRFRDGAADCWAVQHQSGDDQQSGRHVQYGFETIGPDVWITDVGPNGNVQDHCSS